jgi:hypothetical protein
MTLQLKYPAGSRGDTAANDGCFYGSGGHLACRIRRHPAARRTATPRDEVCMKEYLLHKHPAGSRMIRQAGKAAATMTAGSLPPMVGDKQAVIDLK